MSNNKKPTVVIHVIPGTNTLVIKKLDPDDRFFITTADSIIISKRGLITIANYLLQNNYLDKRVIEGLLEEYNTV